MLSINNNVGSESVVFQFDYNLCVCSTSKIRNFTEPTDLLPHEMQQYTAWQSKFIDHWQPQDCLFWLIHELQELKLARALPEVR